jgi:DNA-binding LacI/PurR family transcriptional regulator
LGDYFDTAPGIDGIVAASDVIAATAIRVLGERGVAVPEGIAVVGHDDLPLAAQISPSLTTIRHDLREGAHQLVNRLFRRLGGDLCDSIAMRPELIVRASAP